MAFPAEVQTVTVNMGPVLTAGGEPVVGAALQATLTTQVLVLSDGAILPSTVFVRTGSDGRASLTLAATDSVGLDTTGFTYRITAYGVTKDVPLPAAAPVVDVEDLVEVEASTGTVWVPPTGWVQDADLATVATTGAYGDLTGRPTLGTAATADLEDLATAEQGAKADRLALAVASFVPLKRALAAADRSCAVQVLGDSTGNDTTEWPYLLAQHIAAAYPAWTVQHRLWSDTTQDYGSPTTIQTGTAGTRALDGSTGTATRRLDASVSPHLSGTIDARFRVSLDDWTPAAQVNFGGRSLATGTRGWYCLINTAGVPVFAYSVDGTAIATTAVNASLSIVDGTTSWVRYLFTPNDGAGNRVFRAYKSSDGLTWTQVGATVTTAGAVTLFDPQVGYEVGGAGGGFGNPGLKVYEVQYRDGENGPNVVPALPDLWPPYASISAYFTGAPVLTVLNGSHPGANLSYLTDATRLPKLTPDYGQRLTLLSSSHNEGTAQGRAWENRLETARAAITGRVSAPLALLTQNPQTTAATWHREHAMRRIDTLAWARAKSLDALDTYQVFLDHGPTWPADLMADSAHPNTTGQQLWTDTLTAALDATT